MTTLKQIWAFIKQVIKSVLAFIHSLMFPSVTSGHGTSDSKDWYVATGKAAGAAVLTAIIQKYKSGTLTFDKTEVTQLVVIAGGIFLTSLEARMGTSPTIPTEKQQDAAITK
jgi:hypothetical protein